MRRRAPRRPPGCWLGSRDDRHIGSPRSRNGIRTRLGKRVPIQEHPRLVWLANRALWRAPACRLAPRLATVVTRKTSRLPSAVVTGVAARSFTTLTSERTRGQPAVVKQIVPVGVKAPDPEVVAVCQRHGSMTTPRCSRSEEPRFFPPREAVLKDRERTVCIVSPNNARGHGLHLDIEVKATTIGEDVPWSSAPGRVSG